MDFSDPGYVFGLGAADSDGHHLMKSTVIPSPQDPNLIVLRDISGYLSA